MRSLFLLLVLLLIHSSILTAQEDCNCEDDVSISVEVNEFIGKGCCRATLFLTIQNDCIITLNVSEGGTWRTETIVGNNGHEIPFTFTICGDRTELWQVFIGDEFCEEGTVNCERDLSCSCDDLIISVGPERTTGGTDGVCCSQNLHIQAPPYCDYEVLSGPSMLPVSGVGPSVYWKDYKIVNCFLPNESALWKVRVNGEDCRSGHACHEDPCVRESEPLFLLKSLQSRIALSCDQNADKVNFNFSVSYFTDCNDCCAEIDEGSKSFGITVNARLTRRANSEILFNGALPMAFNPSWCPSGAEHKTGLSFDCGDLMPGEIIDVQWEFSNITSAGCELDLRGKKTRGDTAFTIKRSDLDKCCIPKE